MESVAVIEPKEMAQARAKLIVADCRAVLRKLRGKSIHLIVPSPPYNLGKDYGSWDDNISFADYLSFARGWLTECHRVLVDGGRICLNVPIISCKNGIHNMMYEYLSLMRKLAFRDREVIIWVKKRRYVDKAMSFISLVPARPILRHPTEAVIVMEKGQSYLIGNTEPDITQDEFLDWTYNMWEIPPEYDRSHPAPYPEELPRRLIKLYSFPGQIVLDPFLGSVTTMKASLELSRNCIGIDIDRDYAMMAEGRMRKDGFSVPVSSLQS